MNAIKKIAVMLGLLLIVIGAVTSLVLVGQAHQWVAFVGELIVVGAAIPTIVRLFKFLIS